jgi:ABC-type multidrug transport system permease subunit
MHIHFLAGAILHATAVAVIGFFVLFAAGKADGIVKLVGTLLGWWIWILAVLLVVCAVFCPTMGDHMGMHTGWMHPMAPPPPAAAAPANPPAAPAMQAAPAPKKP